MGCEGSFLPLYLLVMPVLSQSVRPSQRRVQRVSFPLLLWECTVGMGPTVHLTVHFWILEQMMLTLSFIKVCLSVIRAELIFVYGVR